MLYRQIIAVCSQIHTKHINTPCGQNVELLNVNPGGTYSDHCAVNLCLRKPKTYSKHSKHKMDASFFCPLILLQLSSRSYPDGTVQ